jgi:hypothetical protein
LGEFETQRQALADAGISVVAASTDSQENAAATAGALSLRYPVAYGLPLVESYQKLGSFYEERRNILHATGFLLRPGGEIAIALYSSGAIGRLRPDEIIRHVGFWKSKG